MSINIKPDKTLVSVCGLFCASCGIYNATCQDDTETLKRIADRMKVPYDEIRCEGCRSQTRTAYCKNCFMQQCAASKKIDFCGECAEYPCPELKDFQSKMPHRAELWKSQQRIKEVGWENWYGEMLQHFTCSQCGSLNGWYDITCRVCGYVPGSTFAQNNMEALKTAFKS
mgnify:FL=1